MHSAAASSPSSLTGSSTNPGRLVFGLGFLPTTGSVLTGFATTWVQVHSKTGGCRAWKALTLPLALSLLTGAVGLAAIYFLGQIG